MSNDISRYEIVFWKWWLRSFTVLPLVAVVALLIHPVAFMVTLAGWVGAAALFCFIMFSVEIWSRTNV